MAALTPEQPVPIPSEIAQRLAELQQQIATACARAGRAASEVTFMAVSKTVEAARIREAIAAGVRVLGENRVRKRNPSSPSCVSLAIFSKCSGI
jgi:uncharacterized pyridoxal phosphate-containing UPF0001 family protein